MYKYLAIFSYIIIIIHTYQPPLAWLPGYKCIMYTQYTAVSKLATKRYVKTKISIV